MILSIILPTRGRPKRLKYALESIYRTVPHNSQIEIVVVDDDDDAETLLAIQNEFARPDEYLPDVTLNEITIHDIRYAPVKWNLGAAASNGDALFLGEDDILWQPGWYETARQLLDNGFGYIGVYGGYEHACPTNYIVTKDWARKHLGGVLTPPCFKSQPGDLFVWSIAQKCEDSIWANGKEGCPIIYVENMHPYLGKSDWDDTYIRGHKYADSDMEIFRDLENRGFPIDWQGVF